MYILRGEANPFNPFKAPTSLPVLTSSKFIHKRVSSSEGVKLVSIAKNDLSAL